MKLFGLSLFFAVVAAIEFRGVQPSARPSQGKVPATDDILADQIRTAVQHARAKGPVGAATSDKVLADQILTAVQHAKASPVVAATVDEILAEVKHRVEVCGESGSPLAGLTLDDLFAELRTREAAKKCDKTGDAQAGAGGAAAGAAGVDAAAGDAGVVAEELATTTTTTTPPCPYNFMDEIIDQANAEFAMFDTNKDGCLEDGELTLHLKQQIEIARQRDYYWIRRNVTDAARDLIKEGKKTHAAADENDSGCLNKAELDDIHHAICDCATQFMFMDHNADGKISRQEAATFVSDHMPQADINYRTLRKIFKAADTDVNRYLSQKEFCEAGPKYQGDGPSAGVVKPWLPPAPAPGPAPAL